VPPYLRLVRTEPPRARPHFKPPSGRPTPTQLDWLRRGLDRAGGDLPIFDTYGQRVNDRTMKSCVDRGWAETRGKVLRDWHMCQLTPAGRRVLDAD